MAGQDLDTDEQVNELVALLEERDQTIEKHEALIARLSADDDSRMRQMQGMVDARDERIDELEKQIADLINYHGQVVKSQQAWYDEAHRLMRVLDEANTDRCEEVPHETTVVLDRAADLVTDKRAAEYGPPTLAFGSIGKAWQAYREACGDRSYDGRDVAQMMTMFKCIRDAIKAKPDNLDDGAGYQQCAAWVEVNR